eukprot:763129-Hanusia_phi.AAC.10
MIGTGPYRPPGAPGASQEPALLPSGGPAPEWHGSDLQPEAGPTANSEPSDPIATPPAGGMRGMTRVLRGGGLEAATWRRRRGSEERGGERGGEEKTVDEGTLSPAGDSGSMAFCHVGWLRHRWKLNFLLILVTMWYPTARAQSTPSPFNQRNEAKNLLHNIQADVCNGLHFDFRYLIGRTFESLYGPYVLLVDDKHSFKPTQNFSYCSILSSAGIVCDAANEMQGINRTVDSDQCSLIFAYLEKTVSMDKISRWLEFSACATEMRATEVVGDRALEMLKFEFSRFLISYLSLNTDISRELLCEHFNALPEDPEYEFVPKNQDIRVCNNSAPYACSPKDWRWCDNATSSEKSSVDFMYSDLLQSQLQNVRNKVLQSLDKYLRSLVGDAFSWVLERDPSSQEEESLLALLEQGRDFKFLIQYLHSTKEYRIKCAAAFCTANCKRAVDNVFHEVLLRSADPVALRRYADMLHEGMHTTKLRQILKDSDEYTKLCIKDGVSVCDGARSLVRELYLKVLGRYPDLGGLTSYARQLVLGKITDGQLQNELESSEEFINGAGLRRKAVSIVESLKKGYAECSDARFSENSYWRGRWCDRSGCDDNDNAPCATFPVKMVVQTEMELAGLNSSLSPQDDGRYEKLLRTVTNTFIKQLGRYPDRGFLIANMGKYMANEKSMEDLETQLKSSDERRANLEHRTQEPMRIEWINKINILANLMLSYNVTIPKQVHRCFLFNQEDMNNSSSKVEFVDSTSSDSLLCQSHGKVLSILQYAWNDEGPLLGLQQDANPVLPIAMYVNERPQYFVQVVRSLRSVHNIDKVAAIVISMDSVKQEMLEIALSIDFAPFRIIFHPVNDDLLKNQPLLAIKVIMHSCPPG